MVKKGGGLHQDGTGGQSLCQDPFGQFVERELYIVVYRRMENWRMSRSVGRACEAAAKTSGSPTSS
jgi:hypothetical protein